MNPFSARACVEMIKCVVIFVTIVWLKSGGVITLGHFLEFCFEKNHFLHPHHHQPLNPPTPTTFPQSYPPQLYKPTPTSPPQPTTINNGRDYPCRDQIRHQTITKYVATTPTFTHPMTSAQHYPILSILPRQDIHGVPNNNMSIDLCRRPVLRIHVEPL